MTSPGPSELIAALQRTFGTHPGRRPVHAKGIACVGTFTGSADGARVCRAAHLRGEAVPVVARLSNGSGYPNAPDWVRDRRGLAVRFAPQGGPTSDLVSISHPVYFAREPSDLVDFSRMRLRDYLAAHPYAARAIAIAQSSPLPASYATIAYHAVHAFALLDVEGVARWARWHWLPDAGRRPLATRAARERSPDYLRDELVERLADGPVRFELDVELADDGDPLDDPTALWHGEREHLHAGTLELVRPAPELDDVAFDPTNVGDGIELSNDPVLRARGGAYRRSAAVRSQVRET